MTVIIDYLPHHHIDIFMKHTTTLFALASAFVALQATADDSKIKPELYEKVKPLSPEESMKTIQVPEGYKLQLVASEPMIKEPVDCVWDAQGNMYVIEMTTYMLDADATGQRDKMSRVIKLQDTDGDGVMDKSTVFADGMYLPRMILPLDDRILICETDTLDIYAYRDTTGDGKADEKKIWYKGGPRGGNLEHQSSGLIWNVDNWIYTTKGAERFKVTDGKVIVDRRGMINGQWGLAHDDDGHFSAALSGGEKSFQYFQNPTVYGRSTFPNELEPDFNAVWPIDNIPDTQGGARRLREDNTLNHVTAACGHGVYRGDLMPEFFGSYLLCEPVGRLIRCAVVDRSQGFAVMKNAYPKSEFIRSTDANFRPVNLKTGPDGALYIVDMYRGIIQEGNWTAKGSYLRKTIDEWGLAKNIQHGRIYRLVPEDYKQNKKQEDLLAMASKDLIPFLGETNGWHRSTARKLLILRNDDSVVEDLLTALKQSKNSQEQIEILWTLEGLSAVDSKMLKPLIHGEDARVAVHALRVADPFLKSSDAEILESYQQILNDDQVSAELMVQAFLSMKTFGPGNIAKPFLAKFNAKHAEQPSLKPHLAQWERDQEAARKHREFQLALKGKGPHFERVMNSGKKHYSSLCFACHGQDGQGVPMAGTEMKLAAPLAGSKRVTGKPETLIKIALHGLSGPIDGKTYPGVMESLSSHNDKYIADVLTYIRNSWGNSGKMILDRDVRQVRKLNRGRKTPWTLEELAK